MAPILERTLALIKPDAVANGNASEIKQLIELRGFTIIEARHLQVRTWDGGIAAHTAAMATK